MKFVIEGKLNGLNEYVNACRTNVHAGNHMKRTNQAVVRMALLKARGKGSMPKMTKYPCSLNITWYEPDNRRDVDNVTFGVKFILDELVNLGVIENDSRKYVSEIHNTVLVDKHNPRIEVEIKEKE